MKSQTKITVPKPVVQPPSSLDSVTLELTGREAFLLASQLGTFNGYQNMDNSNKGRVGMPLSRYPKSLTNEVKLDETNFFFRVYEACTKALEKAKQQGVE